MVLAQIPIKRKILTEKISDTNSKDKKLYIFELKNGEVQNRLLIKLLKSPRAKIERHLMNEDYQNGYSVYWKPIEFVVLENYGESDAGIFCKWVNDSMSNKKHQSLARNITLIRLLDNHFPSGEEYVITGSLIEEFKYDGKNEIFLRLNYNNCSVY
jgi:hypothetical protein